MSGKDSEWLQNTVSVYLTLGTVCLRVPALDSQVTLPGWG